MHTFLETLSENAQFVLLCLGITAGVLLLAWVSEKLVMRRRHRLNAAHTITTIAMLAAISGVRGFLFYGFAREAEAPVRIRQNKQFHRVTFPAPRAYN